MYEHVKYVLLTWLHLNGYRVRNEEFEQLAFSHPDFPSIQAVVDALAEMKIECLAVSVPKEALEELDANILVYISDGKHEQLAIFRGWDKDKVALIVDSNLTIYLSKEDFLKNWNGTVVAIEANSAVDRVVDFKSLLGKVEFIVSLFFVVGISVLLITTRGQLYSILSFMLSILGLFICTQIVKHELGVKTGILKKGLYVNTQ